MDRRRESLGRNRQGPATRNTVPTMIAVAVALSVGGFAAFRYFTQPQRVFGTKALKCSATEVSWQVTDGKPHTYLITGCGREVRAVCPPDEVCLHTYPVYTDSLHDG